MLANRKMRIAAAVFILTAVLNLLWPRMTGQVSTFAVVNAPVVTVRAPINGRIVRPAPGLASPVTRDDILIDIRATFEHRAEAFARLEGERLSLKRKIAALAREAEAVASIADALRLRARAETAAETAFLAEKLAEARAARRGNEVAFDRAAARFDRLSALAERRVVPAADLSAAEFDVAGADAALAADDARIAALEIELAAIEDGLPSPAGTGRRDFAYDRLHDVEMALADLRTRRSTAEGQLAGVERALARLGEDVQRQDRFRPVAATNGVIWTASRAAGASVTLGADLVQVLDCERRFLEVVFPERSFESLPPGTMAEVRLRGGRQTFAARVVSRHAAARGGTLSAVDAAVLSPYEDGGVKVFLALEPADVTDPAVAAAFCDVGRTAEVRIRDPRIGRALASLRRAAERLGVAGVAILADAAGSVAGAPDPAPPADG